MRACVAALLVLVALPVYAGDRLDSFAFEGVPLSANVTNFKRYKPTAQFYPKSSEKANGMECYVLVETQSSSGAMFYFLDSQLYQIQVLYDADRINKMGGVLKTYEKVTAAFGQPDDRQQNDSAIKLVWTKSNHAAEFIITNTNAVLSVKDTQLENLLNERRAKGTSLGF